MRLFACQALMFVKDPFCVSQVAKLLNDPEKRVRATAVRTLGWLGDASQIDGVLLVYKSDGGTPDADYTFADALARLGEEDVSLKCACNSMTSANWNIRHFAVEALAFNKSRSVVPAVVGMLDAELKRTVADMKGPRVGDRVFVGLYTLLKERTGQSFGDDVPRWQSWWAKARHEYNSPAVEFDAQASIAVLDEYRKLKTASRQ